METALTGLIVITLLLFAVLTIAQAYMTSQAALLSSWQDMEARLGDQAHTNLSPVRAETSGGGSIVKVTLENSGSTKFADLSRWDVIVQYHDTGGGYVQKWLPYDELGGSNKWTVSWSEGTTETFEPRILNQGETMVLQLDLDPAVAMTTTNLVTIATPNGATAQVPFNR